jgi:hypothetical protein
MIRNSIVLLFAIVLLCLPAYPQENRGVITGQVMDPSGAVVPGAQVTATQTETKVVTRTTTTATGNYSIPSLPIGTYEVRIEAAGFRQFVTQGLTLMANSTLRVNAKLELGPITEQVTVTAQAAQLQTENAAIRQTIGAQMVEQLPVIVGGGPRGVFELAQVTPEMTQDVGMSGGGSGFAGAQRGGTAAALDGVSVTAVQRGGGVTNINTPPVDAIGELSTQTHGFSAEYGRAAGGKITFASKSGTNQVHGTAFEYLRNDKLDARRFFETKRAVLKQNDFGGSIGGPVYIPGLYDGRDKTFFFATAELFRNRVGAAGDYYSVPTPEMYQGDFSNWVDANGSKLIIYDPATTRQSGKTSVRDPFQDNKIPANRISAYATAVLKYLGTSAYPNAKATTGTSAYVRNNYQNNTGITMDPWNKWTVKIDHAFNANNKVSFLYNDNYHETAPGPEGFPGLPGVLSTTNGLTETAHVYRGTYNRVLTPTIVYSAFGGANIMDSTQWSPGSIISGWSAKGICLKGAVDCNAAFPQNTFDDYSQWGGVASTIGHQKNITFGNDLTTVRRNHSIKVGYMFERLSWGSMGSSNIQGTFGATRQSTNVPGATSLAGGGNAFASFLLGYANSASTANVQPYNNIWRTHAMYVQDDWKVTPKFTLNLGLRYEATLPIIDSYDAMSNFNPNKANTAAGGLLGALDFAGTGEGRTGTRTLSDAWWGGIAPRFGFAYSLTSMTVIRGGFGRSFDVVRANNVGTHSEGFSISYSKSTLDNGVTPALLADTGFPTLPTVPRIDPTISNGLSTAWWKTSPSRLPETYDFSLSIQQRLTGSIVLESSYNGTMGVHLASNLYDPNQLPYSYIAKYGLTLLNSGIDSAAAIAAGIKRPFSTIDSYFASGKTGVTVAQCLRPYPMYGSIDVGTSNGERAGHSTYHSWNTQINKRYSEGLSLQASYVLSKLIGNADANPASQAVDSGNPGLEKSLSQYDRTHLVKYSFVYELPLGKGKQFLQSGPLAAIVGGWRLTGIGIYQSGLPIQLANTANLGLHPASTGKGGGGGNRAMVTTLDNWVTYTGGSKDWLGGDLFLQPASFFGTQPTDQIGNAPRYNGKARLQWDQNESLSLARTVKITEDVKIDIRADAFNILNRTKFAVSSTQLGNANFGRVTGTLNQPRRMQFALKIYF